MYFGVDNFTFEWYDSKTVIESKARTERTGHSRIYREMAVGVSHDARDQVVAPEPEGRWQKPVEPFRVSCVKA